MAGLGPPCRHPTGPAAGLRCSERRSLLVTIPLPTREWLPEAKATGPGQSCTQLGASIVFRSQGPTVLQGPGPCPLLLIHQLLRQAGTQGSGTTVFSEDLLKYSQPGARSPCWALLQRGPRAKELAPPLCWDHIIILGPAGALCFIYWFSPWCHQSAALFPLLPDPCWDGGCVPLALGLAWHAWGW